MAIRYAGGNRKIRLNGLSEYQQAGSTIKYAGSVARRYMSSESHRTETVQFQEGERARKVKHRNNEGAQDNSGETTCAEQSVKLECKKSIKLKRRFVSIDAYVIGRIFMICIMIFKCFEITFTFEITFATS